MRKLILKMSISVDGFVGRTDGAVDWVLNTMDDKAAAYVLDLLSQAGDHIVGSRTFNDMRAYWPYSNNPFAKPMNEIPKIVFSKNGLKDNDTSGALTSTNKIQPADNKHGDLSSWENATILNGDLHKEITRLKEGDGKPLLVHGGASFVSSLIKTGLIDEYHLITHPVALGEGLSIFTGQQFLKLENTTVFKSGTIAHVYKPAQL
jgi:dihydrofolate reductase